MTTITIHYESPASDPLKVPRPHRVTIGDDGQPSRTKGGEAGVGGVLLGFCTTSTPDVDAWALTLAKKLYDGDVHPDELIGQYAQFADDDGMYGYEVPISRVEVTA